tara:strand:- start:3863 stop:4012 length:150 start_codon:yes stop_codon:yes gene_type:complete
MDLLLVLQAFGTDIAPGSDASLFDFDGDGFIGMADFLQMLSQQPPILKQ